mmetsp:Transcript_9758/g.21892  ORF Transcript_9758/g.21892 Transcript_9758/m.21892 type:complete len:473 (-) Transcript_9758:735-2153(-)
MAARTVLSGPSSLRTHLKSRVSSLRRSPCLIVASDLPSEEQSAAAAAARAPPPANIRSFRHVLSDDVNRAGFTASMELGLRTVNCTVTGAYPTWDDVGGGIDMARRVGATTVLGVGAGAAVDCAKAVASALREQGSNGGGSSSNGGGSSDDSVELILAPSTLGGTMAAMSSSPLLLSTAEEALLPPYLACPSERGATPADFGPVGATVCLDGDGMAFLEASHRGGGGDGGGGDGDRSNMEMAMATPVDAALASLTVCVESSILLAETMPSSTRSGDCGDDDNTKVMHTLLEGARSNAMATLDAYTCRRGIDGNSHGAAAAAATEEQKVAHLHAAASVAHAAQLLRYGDPIIDRRRRSISIALCSSLLPRYFPHGHALTFMASLLPGLCESLCTGGNGSKSVRIGEQEIRDVRQWSNEITHEFEVPKLVTMAEGTPDVDTLMKRVDSISSLMGCEEVGGYDLVEAVLHRSLNR